MTVAANGEADLRWKDGSVFHFAPTNTTFGSALTSITDANGNRTTLVRNPARPAQITEVIGPAGRKLLASYDGVDRITAITDPIGREVRYTYNAQGTLETVTDPEGGVTRYDCDAENRLDKVTDARGVVVAENTYDENGRVIEQRRADGGIIRFAYKLLNPEIGISPVEETTVTDPLGRVTVYRFNPAGFLVSVIDPLGQTRVFERAPGTNQLLALKGPGTCEVCGDPAAGDQALTYDENGNLRTVTDALDAVTTFTYEPNFNKIESITDALGHVVTSRYDGASRVIETVDPLWPQHALDLTTISTESSKLPTRCGIACDWRSTRSGTRCRSRTHRTIRSRSSMI